MMQKQESQTALQAPVIQDLFEQGDVHTRRLMHSRARGLTALLVAALSASSPAFAREAGDAEAEGEAHPGEHHAEYPNLVGFRVGYLAALSDAGGGTRLTSFAYLGVMLERTVIHDVLELEISVPVAIAPGREVEIAMPVDVHLKVPFHPSPRWSPYVALGPALDVIFTPESDVLFGVSSAVGTYYWFSERTGVDVELDYNLLLGHGHPVHELLIAVGPVLRF